MGKLKQDIINVEFIWLKHGEGLPKPEQQSLGAAGLDICAANKKNHDIVISAKKYEIIPSGFSIALPIGYEAQIRPRSGLAAKYGVTVLNSPGTIDADYRGEIKIILINHGEDDFIIKRGDRIAQMLIAPVSEVCLELKVQLSDTKRGQGGFGSTG